MSRKNMDNYRIGNIYYTTVCRILNENTFGEDLEAFGSNNEDEKLMSVLNDLRNSSTVDSRLIDFFVNTPKATERLKEMVEDLRGKFSSRDPDRDVAPDRDVELKTILTQLLTKATVRMQKITKEYSDLYRANQKPYRPFLYALGSVVSSVFGYQITDMLIKYIRSGKSKIPTGFNK